MDALFIDITEFLLECVIVFIGKSELLLIWMMGDIVFIDITKYLFEG